MGNGKVFPNTTSSLAPETAMKKIILALAACLPLFALASEIELDQAVINQLLAKQLAPVSDITQIENLPSINPPPEFKQKIIGIIQSMQVPDWLGMLAPFAEVLSPFQQHRISFRDPFQYGWLTPSYVTYEQIDFLVENWIKDAVRKKLIQANLKDNPSLRNIKDDYFVAIAGPATKDGVASYNMEKDNIIIRIQYGQNLAYDIKSGLASLHKYAKRWGYALNFDFAPNLPAQSALSMLRNIQAKGILPAWALTANALIPVTLREIRQGDVCDGNGWLEITMKGQQQPAIWAIFLLPPHIDASKAKVRRLTAEWENQDDGGYRAKYQSKLQINWQETNFPIIQVTAKQFKDNVWGTRIVKLLKPETTQTKTNQDASEYYSEDKEFLGSFGTPPCPLE